MLGDAEGDTDGEALGEALGLALGEGEGEGLTLGDGDALGEADGLGEAEGLEEGDVDGLADGEGSVLGLGDGSSDGLALGDAEGSSEGPADGEALSEALAEGLGDAVGVSADAEAFWASETSLTTKSAALSLVSSPLPPAASAASILAWLDAELAFLSTLLSSAGTVKAVPSTKELAGAPKVTASTIIPVSTSPFLKAKLLLLETVSVLFLSHDRVGSSKVLHHKKYP